MVCIIAEESLSCGAQIRKVVDRLMNPSDNLTVFPNGSACTPAITHLKNVEYLRGVVLTHYGQEFGRLRQGNNRTS